MDKKIIHDSLIHISELLNADLSMDKTLKQVGQVINAWIPNDQLWFHFVTLGLNYRLVETGLDRYESRPRWQEDDANKSAVRWVLANGTVIKRDDIAKEKRFDRDQERIQDGTHSQLVVPFVFDQQTIGVMNFVSQTPHLYTDTHVENALLFARLVAAEIHQMYLRQEMRGIGEISRAIQSSSDLDHILMLVLKHIQDLGYDRVRVYLYDEKEEALIGAVQVGSDSDVDFKGIILPVDEDRFSQQTFQSSGARIYMSTPEDLVTYAYVKDALGAAPPQTWADLPLYVLNDDKKRIVGKISLDNIISQQPLIQSRLDRLMIYAAQAANAIWKAQLYQGVKDEVVRQTQTLQNRVKQRGALLEMNRAVQGLQRKDDVALIVEIFYKELKSLGFDFLVLTVHRLIDEQKQIFETYEAIHGVAQQKIIQKVNPAFHIWKNKHLHYRKNLGIDLEDVSSDFHQKAKEKYDVKFLSTLSAPLGRGVLTILSTQSEAFDDEEIRFFDQLASILSVGLDRVHDLERIEKETQRQAALAKINRAVQALQRSEDMQQVIGIFYQNLVDMGFDFRVLTIHRLIDEQKMVFETYEVMDEQVYRKNVRVHERVFAIWKRQKVHYRRNLSADLEDLKPRFIERARADIGITLASTLSVPLQRGVISMLSTSVEAFDERDISLFEQFANVLSVGLDRVHDLERIEKENQTQAALAKINRAVLNMQNPNELSDVALVFFEAIQQMGVPAQAVAIHRLIDADESLVETFRVCDPGQLIYAGKRQAFSIVAHWKKGGVFYDPNLETVGNVDSFREKFLNLEIVSFMSLPFAMGVISVHSIYEDAFSEQDVLALTHVAEILSVGIKRLEDMEALEAQFDLLKENEARYRNLIRLMDGVVYALDWKTKQYTYMDESVYDLTGYKPEELDHALCQSLIEDEIELTRFEHIPPQIQLHSENIPTVFRSKYSVNTKDGKKVWIMDCSLEFRDKSGELQHTLGILLNMTDQRVMEEGLRQSQKMEAIGQLAGGVAHDFNNLLTGILGLSSLLLLRLPEGDPNRKDVEDIQKAGNRAADLTKQLLAFSRKQMIEPQVLDVNGVMSDMQSMLRRLIREDIELVVSLASVTKPIEMDRGQLEQIILNLVVNAKDAMPQGGTIFIKTNQVILDMNQARFMRGLTPGAYVTFEVADTGTGMDEETQEHIFEPFFTTKGQGEGTGLGLATVYGVVAQNGGHIDVESALGEGSVFRVYIPQTDKPFDLGQEKVAKHMLVGCETILVAEDEELVRNLVQRTLGDLGYHVLVAQDGHQALQVWNTGEQAIDLLVTDVVMPNMGGKELAENLRQQRAHLPILYMSGYAEERTSGDALHLQASAFLKKPFMPDELVREVRNLLDGVKRSV